MRIKEEELPRFAQHMGIGEDEFIQKYTRLTPQRTGLALIDNPDGSCYFLNGRDCTLQGAKPEQCIGFPNTWNFPGWRDVCEAIPIEIPDKPCT